MGSLVTDFTGIFEPRSTIYGTVLTQACRTQNLVSARKIVDRVKGSKDAELLNTGGTWYHLPPLLHVAMIGNFELVELLVDNGANVNLHWKDEGIALGFACEMGHLGIA